MLQHRHHPAFSAGCGRPAGCGPDVAWPEEARPAAASRPRPAEIDGRSKMHPRANKVDMGEPIRASPPIQIEPKPSHTLPRKQISFYAQSILIWSLATCCERHGGADRREESRQRVLSPPTRSHQFAFTASRSLVDDSYGSKVRYPTPRLYGDSLRGGPGDSATSTRLCSVPP